MGDDDTLKVTLRAEVDGLTVAKHFDFRRGDYLFDVGYDYEVGRDGDVRLLKGSFYGLL